MTNLSDKDLFIQLAKGSNVSDYSNKYETYLTLTTRIICDYLRDGKLSKLTRIELNGASNKVTAEQVKCLTTTANHMYALVQNNKFSTASNSRTNINGFLRYTITAEGKSFLNELIKQRKDFNWIELLNYLADEKNKFCDSYLITEWSNYSQQQAF